MEQINLKSEIKLLKAFNSLFQEQEQNDVNKAYIMPPGTFNYMTDDNVCMITLKSDHAKQLFKRFIDASNVNALNRKSPELDYKCNSDTFSEMASNYNIIYLQRMLKCFEAIAEKVTIKIKNDYPITLEGEHFNFILAPRVGNN